MSRADRFYIVLTLFLLITAMAGGIMLAVQHSRSQPVEIVISQTEPPVQIGEVYISGTVVNPGIYSIMEGDTLQALLSDAGIDPDADLSGIQIYVPRKNAEQPSQKIDINRAEPWLLEALPGIGEVIAQRIVDYRTENGPFRTIEDLLKVSGIGQATFEKIKYYITVSD